MSRTKTIFAAIGVAALAACGQETPTSAPPASAAVPTALEMLLDGVGGAAALDGIETVTIETAGRRFALDEHFMPGDVESNPIPFTSAAYYDAASDSLRIDSVRTRDVGEQAASLIIAGELGVISGQDAMFAPPGDAAMTSDRWAAVRKEAGLLNPHIAYRRQLIDGNVTQAADTMLNGANHHVLVIDAPVAPISLYINADSGELAKLTTMEAEYLRRDVDIEVMYDNWAMAEGGIAFPNDITLIYDGETMHEETRRSVSVNTPLAPGLFDFPAGVRPMYDEALARWGRNGHQIIQMMAAVGFPYAGTDENVQATEIAPGVFHVAGGSHHSLVIEQASGLVVAEAPKHELRSEAVIGWIEETLPDKPLTHIIATHHHTDHTGGMRAYIARGATAVVHEAAREYFAEIFSRPSTLRPDALARNPRAATIETMPAAGMVSIPDDERAVEVYPLANDHAGDMALIYVRGPGIVFVSDIYSPNPNAPAGPGGQTVQDAIEAAGIDVNTIAGGHGGVIDYATFLSLL